MSGFKVFSTGQDLDSIFQTRTTGDPSTALVPYVTPDGQKLRDRYYPYQTGNIKAPPTRYKLYNPLNKTAIIDLSDLYAYNTGFRFTYDSDATSVQFRTASVSDSTYVSITYLSKDLDYAHLGVQSRYTSGTFTVTDPTKIQAAKVILVSGGGGGGNGGGANGLAAGGGGGGAVYNLDISFVDVTTLQVDVGNGGRGAYRNSAATVYPASRGGSSMVTVTNGTAIINNNTYNTTDFFDASNNGYAGGYWQVGAVPYTDFNPDATRSNSIHIGAGSGGGGGAYSSFKAALVSGGVGNPGSAGSDASSVNTVHLPSQCAGGGGGGGANAVANNRVVTQTSTINDPVFGGDSSGAPGMPVSTTAFGSTYYGGGGGAAQGSAATADVNSAITRGPGGNGGGGTAFRNITAASGGATGGAGGGGLGGGGGGISAQRSGTWELQGGPGGHGTVIVTFKMV